MLGQCKMEIKTECNNYKIYSIEYSTKKTDLMFKRINFFFCKYTLILSLMPAAPVPRCLRCYCCTETSNHCWTPVYIVTIIKICDPIFIKAHIYLAVMTITTFDKLSKYSLGEW